jgi:tetratricopeptide (TPR) repeat protein
MNVLTAALLTFSLAPARAAEHKEPAYSNSLEAQWMPLVEAKSLDKAKNLCGGWLSSKDAQSLTEAHKCMAELEMAQGKVDEALKDLDTALGLTPADVNAHDSKLQVLMWARRFSEMPAALETAIKDCGKEGTEAWIDFSSRLLDDERFEEGLAYTKVLEKHYPKDFRVIADMGVLLAATHKSEEAATYLKRAVALKPDDALDNWNLGRVYDELGKFGLADAQLRKAIALETEKEKKQEYVCLHSEFLKKRNRPGAAEYEKKNCPGGAPEDE